jgi:HK97 family phage major capsid protein
MRTLRIEGDIGPELQQDFEAQLRRGRDDVVIWVNSMGGDVFCAAHMYTALREYPDEVTVQIDGIAASAASVIAMAGDRVLMSPVAVTVIHNPATIAIGDSAEMARAGAMLDEVKKSIINAYERKTRLSRDELSRLMDAETSFSAQKAVELGFADGILYAENLRRQGMDLVELREKRAALWRQAQDFMDAHSTLSAEEGAVYDKMSLDIDALSGQIERLEKHREMSARLGAPTTKPLFSSGRAAVTDDYTRAFWNAMTGRGVSNALSEGVDTAGGFVVPEQFANVLIERLNEQNVFRRIAMVKRMEREKLKVPVSAVSGTATWLEENEAIPESDVGFSQVQFDAYKIGTMLRSSTKLIEDTAFDIQDHIAREFARRIGAAEEQAFCGGDGNGKPTGLFAAAGGAQIGFTTASTTDITFDDVIELYYSLLPPYRAHAVFLAHDSALKFLRKLKDNNGQYLWEPSVQDGQPDRILGKPVYTSPYVPAVGAGALPLAFGDFSYYWIADRRDVRFRVLNELFAQNDQVGFYATERIDGKLVLPETVKLLQLAAAK